MPENTTEHMNKQTKTAEMLVQLRKNQPRDVSPVAAV